MLERVSGKTSCQRGTARRRSIRAQFDYVAMANVQRVYTRVIEGRGAVSFRDLQRLLTMLGFRLDRISGSHHIYLHPDVSRPVNIQPAAKEAKPYQIRQLRDMIREFGLKLED